MNVVLPSVGPGAVVDNGLQPDGEEGPECFVKL